MRCTQWENLECRNPMRIIEPKGIGYEACLSCPVFVEAKQTIFTDNGGGVLMSLEKALSKKAKEVPKYINITDLPDKIKVLLFDHKFKSDSRGNDCLFLYLRTKDDKTIVQKYGQSAYEEILGAIEDAGGSDLLKVTLTTWQKKMLGQMQKPRLVPLKEE